MTFSRTVRLFGGVGTATVLALALAACGGSGKKASPSATTSAVAPSTSSVSTSAAPAAPTVDPLTGGKVNKNTAVGVKIDDTANGRPQVGIDKADVVYIEQAEGGLTRLLAVFHSQLPTVEAVRSTRASDPELLAQYGPIDYVASGGGGDTLQVLAKSTLHASVNDSGGPGFARDSNRPAPYNLTADLSAVTKALKGSPVKSIGWTFGPAPASPRVANTIHTVVGSTSVDFQWSTKLGRYIRLINGVVQKAADGTVISTPNVIVQFCQVTAYLGDIDVNGNPSQYTHSIGKGEVYVFRNGHAYPGTWSRPTGTDGTTLTDGNGKPIPLAKGGAWVVLANKGATLTRK